MSLTVWAYIGLALFSIGVAYLVWLDARQARRLERALQQALDIANGTHRCGDDTCTEDHGERAGAAS